MPTEDFSDKLKKDNTAGRVDGVISDIYKTLVEDHYNKDQDPQKLKNDFETATKFLSDNGILPGIALVDVDYTDDQSGTGIVVSDRGLKRDEEIYTIDPETGIGRSVDGTIQAIVSPNGKIQRFDYKEIDGKQVLTGVIDAEGKAYEIDPKTGRSRYYDDKNETWVETNGILTVNQQNGDITITSVDGKSKEVHEVNGSMVRTTKGADGSEVVTDVQFAYDPSNKNARGTMHFEYGADGKLSSVRNQEGETWTKQEDGSWKSDKMGPDGQPKISKADFSVDSSGNVTIRQGNSRETYYPDGSKDKVSIENNVTNTVTTDRHGRVTQIANSAHGTTQIQYDSSGKESAVEFADGSKYKSVDGKWQFFDVNGKPSTHQISDVRVFPDGSILVLEANGSRITYQKGGKQNEPASGTR